VTDRDRRRPLIAGCRGNADALDTAIAKFALAYARQTEKDHAAPKKARRDRRIVVDPDVAR